MCSCVDVQDAAERHTGAPRIAGNNQKQRPPDALELAITALTRSTGGASWATPQDASDEATALRRLREDVDRIISDDPAALRGRLASHLCLLEILAVRYAARAESASRDDGRAALAAVSIRALGTAARVAALLAATAPSPAPIDGAGAVPASRRPRLR